MEAGVAAAAVKEEMPTGQQPQQKIEDAQDSVDSSKPASKANQAKVENAPDPDEDFPDPDEDFPDDDDLDDLDDELDGFIAPEPKPQVMAPEPPLPTNLGQAVGGSPGPEEELSNENFSNMMADEMRKFMQELNDSPGMQDQLEQVMGSIQKAVDEEASTSDAPSIPREPSRPGSSASSARPQASFKDTIAGLTAQLKNSDKTTKENLSAEGSMDEDALLAKLLESLGAGEGGDALGGKDGEDNFTNMLMGMMEQLTTKEILYDPMKELQRSFPGWMEANKGKVPAADMTKHAEQLTLVNEIVGKFEEKGYSDQDTERRKYIVDRMQQMQATGSVPADLLGDSPSLHEALSGGPEAGCPVQ